MNTQLIQWNPFSELRGIQNRLSTLFGDSLEGNGEPDDLALADGDWSPAVDVAEDEKEYLITADLPEVEKDDVNVKVDKGVLTISGERHHESEEEDKKKKFHRVERSYGRYTRSFRLPEEVDADKVDAQFKNGVLKVHLPKGEEKVPQAVEVKIH